MRARAARRLVWLALKLDAKRIWPLMEALVNTPHRQAEFFAASIVEIMAQGLPVVRATDVPRMKKFYDFTLGVPAYRDEEGNVYPHNLESCLHREAESVLPGSGALCPHPDHYAERKKPPEGGS